MKVAFYKKVPTFPGVYLFKDKNKEVIYVGKAINLRARVSSYFQKNLEQEKTRALVENIAYVDFIEVASDVEALLLEAKLIKQYQPFYNSRLKDDKDYLYIIFTKEDFPKITTGRKRDIENSYTYFGPFTTARAARDTLRIARRIFPFRTTCKSNSGRGCLSYHLGLCPGVCAGVISRKDYRSSLKKLTSFLNGESNKLLTELSKEMIEASKKQDYEEALIVRNKISSIEKTTKRYEDIDKYLDGPEVLEGIYNSQLKDLAEELNLSRIPQRIECYDISNILGKNSVGSMVVLIDGKISKADYRRFKIKTIEGINDPASMAEVLTRRFHNNWDHPDLLVVDGGKTQLGAAVAVLDQLELSIPVIGLAKKNEEIYRPNEKKPLVLPKNSKALLLVQRIRDEAHRFAITYHRKLRAKSFLPS
ncbi:MAG TPA: excinuclease ABC subunit UvrC [Candidatus Saccharimonadales bacterium]|nr:excinuclease ABC subunit UvrC [Candidatus Saccharimonadales bacterium]